MPAPQRFLDQDVEYRNAVLPPGGKRVSIEAGATGWWRGVVGDAGLTIGIDRFGESAPYKDLLEHFGFTPERIAARVEAWLGGS